MAPVQTMIIINLEAQLYTVDYSLGEIVTQPTLEVAQDGNVLTVDNLALRL